MIRRSRVFVFFLLTQANPAWAGMPALPELTLSAMASFRISAISFFALILLLSALAIMGLWNFLRQDFPKLPRLSYAKALSLTLLLGICFGVVLTMIAGARELMTPGAWIRNENGYTYRLKSEAHEP